MSTTTNMTTRTEDNADLPGFPGTRSARCPFDPPAEYAGWRDAEGLQRVLWHGNPVWLVSRFDDIRAALSDPRISADPRSPGFPVSPMNAAGANASSAFPRMDDPEHARLRRMLTGDFTVRRVDQMRPHIQELVNGFLDQMISKGQPADLVAEYALPIPSMVISLLLGVPYADHEFFQKHSAVLIGRNFSADEKSAASMELSRYLFDLVASKEREPADDIISRQVHERVVTGEISRQTAVVNAMSLLIAGHETTANMIALGTLTLLENPDQLARIRDTDDPALVANAVEELLRYLTIPQDVVARVATEDLTIGGQLIRAGEGLMMNLSAGNRDARFFDQSDTFDIDATTRGHLAFGYGTHQCLGQSLARAELQIALPALLRRLPGLRLAVPMEQVNFRHDMTVYGVHELPVAW